MGWIVATLVCGSAGAWLFHRLRIPAGVMIGAVMGTALFNIFVGQGIVPVEMKLLTQAVSGIFIGSRIQRKDLPVLKQILLPALSSALAMILLCMAMGRLICTISGIDILTAMLACAPGGIVDMSLIAMEMGADTSVVSVLHVVRLVAVISIFPSLLRLLVSRLPAIGTIEKSFVQVPNTNCVASPQLPASKFMKILLTAFVGGGMAVLGKLSGMPAGPLVFSMVGTVVLNTFTSMAYMPNAVKRMAQVLAGTLIGLNVTLTAVMQLQQLLLPALILLLFYFAINLLLMWLLQKLWRFDRMTAFFSCTPGGASDICLMVEDFGGDTPRISIMQTVRMIVVIGLYPAVLRLFF